jgi:hypothetical protein
MPKGSEGFSLAKVGTYAFLLGVLIAIGTAFVPSLVSTGTATALLVVLGLLVGFLNVTQKETVPFLVAALALGLGSSAKFSTLQTVGTYLDAIMANMVTFVAPAAVIVALKAVYELSKEN